MLEEMELKVSGTSDPKKVAGAIASLIKENKYKLVIRVIGAGALNQAVKAIIIARGFLAPCGVDLGFIPSFCIVNMKEFDEEKSGLELKIIKL